MLAGAQALGGIHEQKQALLPAQRHQAFIVGRQSEQVDRHDGARDEIADPSHVPDGVGQHRRVNHESSRIDVVRTRAWHR